jgi:hypothetical protein
MSRRAGDIELRIEELVIEGLPHADARRLAAALERELTLALNRPGGTPFADAPPGRTLAHTSLDAGEVRAPPGASPQAVGRAAAGAVARGLRHLASGSNTTPTRRGRP